MGAPLHALLCTRLANPTTIGAYVRAPVLLAIVEACSRFLLLLKERLSRGRIFKAIVALEKDYKDALGARQAFSDPPPMDGLSSHRPQVHVLKRAFFLSYVGDGMDVAFSDARRTSCCDGAFNPALAGRARSQGEHEQQLTRCACVLLDGKGVFLLVLVLVLVWVWV